MSASFYQIDEISTEAKGEKVFIEKREFDSVKCIGHIQLNDHAFFLLRMAGVKGFFHLDHVVYEVPSFDESTLQGGDQILQQMFESIS